MDKIESLNDLRSLLSVVLAEASGLKRIGDWNHAKGSSDWEVPASEPCVITFGETLSATWRRRKPLDSTEVFRMTKADREEGPTSKRVNYYLVKLARFLDKKGLYAHREVITDETESFIGDKP